MITLCCQLYSKFQLLIKSPKSCLWINVFSSYYILKPVMHLSEEWTLKADRRCSVKKKFCFGVLKIFAKFTGKHLPWSFLLIKLQTLMSATLFKETPTQMFFNEICKIFKNTYFEEYLRTTCTYFRIAVFKCKDIFLLINSN